MTEPSKQTRIDRFLFSPLNAKGVAWFRMALALAIPVLFWSRGFQPNASVPEWLHPAYQHVFVSKGHFLLLLLLCGWLFTGWKARGCLFLILVMVLPLVFTTSGSVSRPVYLLLMTTLLFVPLGTVKLPWLTRGEVPDAGPCWPVRFIQLELTVLHGVNAIAKSTGLYLSGDALVDMSMTRFNFLVDLSSGYLTLGVITLPVMLAAVFSTLTEYTLALGFWIRSLRWWVAALGIGFHFVLLFFVKIHLLHFASIFLYLAFLLPLMDSKKGCEKIPPIEQSSL